MVPNEVPPLRRSDALRERNTGLAPWATGWAHLRCSGARRGCHWRYAGAAVALAAIEHLCRASLAANSDIAQWQVVERITSPHAELELVMRIIAILVVCLVHLVGCAGRTTRAGAMPRICTRRRIGAMRTG